MIRAIKLLRDTATDVRTCRTQHLKNFSEKDVWELIDEYETAANLLEKLSQGVDGPNQVATAAEASVSRELSTYARWDALTTMALFAGVPEKVVPNLVGLLLYLQEIEERDQARKKGGARASSTPTIGVGFLNETTTDDVEPKKEA